MPSRDAPSSGRLLLAQLGKEWRELTSGNALWVLLLLVSLLAGHGFAQAVELYGEASRGAVRSPELAAGLSPLDGIWVPTFGSLYLATTFLFPFLALRLVGGERQSAAVRVQLQLPLPPSAIVAVKAVVLMAAWLLTCLPFIAAISIWRWWGGHVFLPEIGAVLLGHFLYASVLGGVAFLFSSASESAATAGIGTLAAVTASFVLDFAGGAGSGLWRRLATLSLTANVRIFERGILDAWLVARFVILGATLLLLAAIWLHSGRSVRTRVLRSAGLLAIALAATFGVLALPPASRDLSEDRRNSFNPADERALREMRDPLTITISLAPEDSRLQEFDGNVLAKLRRLVPRLVTRYEDPGASGIFGAATDDRYGIIAYEYGGARDESRSTSPREVLPILHGLAHRKVVPEAVPSYPGYPLVPPATSLPGVVFYALIPGLVLGAWWFQRTRPARIRRRSPS